MLHEYLRQGPDNIYQEHIRTVSENEDLLFDWIHKCQRLVLQNSQSPCTVSMLHDCIWICYRSVLIRNSLDDSRATQKDDVLRALFGLEVSTSAADAAISEEEMPPKDVTIMIFIHCVIRYLSLRITVGDVVRYALSLLLKDDVNLPNDIKRQMLPMQELYDVFKGIDSVDSVDELLARVGNVGGNYLNALVVRFFLSEFTVVNPIVKAHRVQQWIVTQNTTSCDALNLAPALFAIAGSDKIAYSESDFQGKRELQIMFSLAQLFSREANPSALLKTDPSFQHMMFIMSNDVELTGRTFHACYALYHDNGFFTQYDRISTAEDFAAFEKRIGFPSHMPHFTETRINDIKAFLDNSSNARLGREWKGPLSVAIIRMYNERNEVPDEDDFKALLINAHNLLTNSIDEREYRLMALGICNYFSMRYEHVDENLKILVESWEDSVVDDVSDFMFHASDIIVKLNLTHLSFLSDFAKLQCMKQETRDKYTTIIPKATMRERIKEHIQFFYLTDEEEALVATVDMLKDSRKEIIPVIISSLKQRTYYEWLRKILENDDLVMHFTQHWDDSSLETFFICATPIIGLLESIQKIKMSGFNSNKVFKFLYYMTARTYEYDIKTASMALAAFTDQGDAAIQILRKIDKVASKDHTYMLDLLSYLPVVEVPLVAHNKPTIDYSWSEDSLEEENVEPVNIWAKIPIEEASGCSDSTLRCVYTCRTCKTDTSAFCEKCAMTCHRGHDILFLTKCFRECECHKSGHCQHTRNKRRANFTSSEPAEIKTDWMCDMFIDMCEAYRSVQVFESTYDSYVAGAFKTYPHLMADPAKYKRIAIVGSEQIMVTITGAELVSISLKTFKKLKYLSLEGDLYRVHVNSLDTSLIAVMGYSTVYMVYVDSDGSMRTVSTIEEDDPISSIAWVPLSGLSLAVKTGEIVSLYDVFEPYEPYEQYDCYTDEIFFFNVNEEIYTVTNATREGFCIKSLSNPAKVICRKIGKKLPRVKLTLSSNPDQNLLFIQSPISKFMWMISIEDLVRNDAYTNMTLINGISDAEDPSICVGVIPNDPECHLFLSQKSKILTVVNISEKEAYNAESYNLAPLFPDNENKEFDVSVLAVNGSVFVFGMGILHKLFTDRGKRFSLSRGWYIPEPSLWRHAELPMQGSLSIDILSEDGEILDTVNTIKGVILTKGQSVNIKLNDRNSVVLGAALSLSRSVISSTVTITSNGRETVVDDTFLELARDPFSDPYSLSLTVKEAEGSVRLGGFICVTERAKVEPFLTDKNSFRLCDNLDDLFYVEHVKCSDKLVMKTVSKFNPSEDFNPPAKTFATIANTMYTKPYLAYPCRVMLSKCRRCRHVVNGWIQGLVAAKNTGRVTREMRRDALLLGVPIRPEAGDKVDAVSLISAFLS